MFPCMKISCTFCWHLGPQILNLGNRKNQPNGKKIHFSCCLFKMDFVAFKISYIIHYLIKCIIYMNIAKHRYIHYLSIKEI